MELNNQFDFLQRRLMLEQDYFDNLKDNDILKSISSVDITTIDLCNRTCVFCPRHDHSVYPNRNLRMTADGATIIASRLAAINYTGTIAISGFGENLLNPEISEITRVLKQGCPTAHVECNTNGDPLTSKLAFKLVDAGIDCININLYDGVDQVDHFEIVMKDIPKEKYKYRAHYNEADHGIIFNNRSGMIDWFKDDTSDLAELRTKPCYYPFYKLYIHWNGDVQFCANDWGRVITVGNVFQQPIKEIWMSKEMQKVRMRLVKKGRDFKPCNNCNVKGDLIGKKSFDMLMDHYNAPRSNG
tara:strand:+ start:534 stop:1433 length:900 start_codon:yes stop_codon:yes gene_type:complete